MKTIIKKRFYLSLITAMILAVIVFLALDILGVQSNMVKGLAIATPTAILILFITIRDK